MAKLEPHPLMRTIVDHPDLDPPRLVYADWLDEQGDPKMALLAEYIRLRVEVESLSPGSERWKDYVKRLREMAELDRDALCPPMPTWAKSAVLFNRGLPYLLNCTLQRFAAGGARALEFAPITVVSLARATDPEADARHAVAAFRRPELNRIRDLSIVAPLDGIALAEIASSPFLNNVRSLNLGLLSLSDEDARTLSDSHQLKQLHRLSISFRESLIFVRRISSRGRAILRAAFGERLKIDRDPA